MQSSTSTDDFFRRVRPDGDPVPDPAAVVRAGSARFTVLTPRLLRLQWAPAGDDDRATLAVVNRRLPVPAYEVSRDGDTTVIDTGALQLRYTPAEPGFTPSTLSIRLAVAGAEVVWTPGLEDPDNLRGTRRTLDATGGPVTLEPGLVSRSGWAVVDDSDSIVLDQDGWVTARTPGERRDWYFFGHGHDYPAAVADYTRIGGAIPLVPRFALGIWWSRFWAYTDDELAEVVRDFRAYGLPLDVLVVDMDWHRDGWTGYSWNRELFPDPAGFLRWAHEQGVRVTLNLHPADGVAPHEDAYPAMAAALGLDPAQRETIEFRIADRAFARAYFEQLHHPLEDEGVDFWWLDWQQGHTSDLPGLDPLPWLNHLHFLDSARRGTRPLIFSRWGGLGSHRYQIGFSGDTFPTWPALRFQAEVTATAANVGYGWWSHDVGGHFGPVDPELYVRWLQAAAVSPALRMHSNKGEDIERRPWRFGPEVLAATAAAFRLRYALVPYLYSYARVAHDTGISLCRPMYYAHPEAESAYHAPEQYLLGDQLLAAPITRPAGPDGAAGTDVWIPEGTWIDLQTGDAIIGPMWTYVSGDLQRVPLFARAASILPLAPLPAEGLPPHLGAVPRDRLVLRVVPGGGRGSFRLYEDDDTTPAYLTGDGEWTDLTAERTGHTLDVHIGAVQGRCAALPDSRGYELWLDGPAPLRATLDGDELTLARTPDRTVVTVPQRRKDRPAHIAVEYAPDAATTPPALPARAPRMHLQDSVRPEQAAAALGHLIVAAPPDGSGSDLHVTWELSDHRGTHRRTTELTAGHTEVVACPFALTGPEQPARWSAHARLRHGADREELRFASAPLLPAVPVYRAVVGSGSGGDAVVLRRPAGGLDHVHQPFVVSLFAIEAFGARLMAGEALRGEFTTVVRSPVARPVLLEVHAYGDVTCRLGGVPPAEATPVKVEPIDGLYTPWIRYVATGKLEPEPTRLLLAGHLNAGATELSLQSRSPEGNPWWEFSVVLRDLDGTALTGVEYEPGPHPGDR